MRKRITQDMVYQSRRPHCHPNQHTDEELKIIQNLRRRNPKLGMVERWHRLRKPGYTRRERSRRRSSNICLVEA